MAVSGALVAAMLSAGCDQFSDDDTAPGAGGGGDGGDGDTAGLGAALGDPGDELRRSDGTMMFVDPTSQGGAGSFRVAEMFWGRLVDIYDWDEATGVETLIHRNYVIGQGVQSDGADYLLESDALTGATKLTILHPRGSEEYGAAFASVHDTLESIAPQGLGGLGPFPAVARNATIVVRFDDLLDPETITSDTVRTFVGNPPATPFGARVLPDPNYGQLFGETERAFRPTRVLIDATVSEAEVALQFPPPPINNVGLPASFNTQQANVAMRLPSQPDFNSGVFAVLQNLAGNTVVPVGSGTLDAGSGSLDVVRVFRSGGASDVSNGFLLDNDPPRIVGQQDVVISNIRCATGGSACAQDPEDLYQVDLVFAEELCFLTPEAGDVLELTNDNFVQLVETATAPDAGGLVQDVLVRDLAASDPRNQLIRDAENTPGLFLSVFEPFEGDRAGCFLSFSPAPGSLALNDNGTPDEPSDDFIEALDVIPGSSVQLRFSEPMDPTSVNALEDIMIARTDGPLAPDLIVVAASVPTPNLRQITIDPILPLSHVNPGFDDGNPHPLDDDPMTYHVRVGERGNGLIDFAGNRVLDVFGTPPRFTLDDSEGLIENGGFVLRFNEPDFDEEPLPNPNMPNSIANACTGPEITGQFLHDPDLGSISGRPVARYSMIIDGDNPTVGAMSGLPIDPTLAFQVTPYDVGTSEPLVGTFGSRTMTMWRYCDMGLSVNGLPPDGSVWNVEDTLFFNLDVEGISWAATGSVLADVFDRFEIALAHAARFPDEAALAGGPLVGTTFAPNSGLQPNSSFQAAALPDGTGDPIKVVYPREGGYRIDPTRAFSSATDTLMMPYPLNEGSDPSEYLYYTWRDTALQALGGESAIGIDLVTAAPTIDPFNHGIPPQVLVDNLGVAPVSSFPPDFPNPTPLPSGLGIAGATFAWQGAIPSVAMPLLMDFRCFPDTGAGFNRPDVRYAGFPFNVGPDLPPDFRLTASGGLDAGGGTVKIDPDLALDPTGGFNQNPGATLGGISLTVGAETSRGDSLFHLGQLDLISRVSRTYTRWVETRAGSSVAYRDPVLFPSNDDQPSGTSIELAFRGASNVLSFTNQQCNNANRGPGPSQSSEALDAYGDQREVALDGESYFMTYGLPGERNRSVTFSAGAIWQPEMQAIDASGFFQARITFVSNPVSGLVPSLNSIGFVYDVTN